MNRDTASVGGRGARERILRAADQLFYQQGIHATGVAALAEEASAAAQGLQEQAKRLTEVAAAFRLDRHDGLIEAQPLIASPS